MIPKPLQKILSNGLLDNGMGLSINTTAITAEPFIWYLREVWDGERENDWEKIKNLQVGHIVSILIYVLTRIKGAEAYYVLRINV